MKFVTLVYLGPATNAIETSLDRTTSSTIPHRTPSQKNFRIFRRRVFNGGEWLARSVSTRFSIFHTIDLSLPVRLFF